MIYDRDMTNVTIAPWGTGGACRLKGFWANGITDLGKTLRVPASLGFQPANMTDMMIETPTKVTIDT